MYSDYIKKFKLPRIAFYGIGCFVMIFLLQSFLSSENEEQHESSNYIISKVFDSVASNDQEGKEIRHIGYLKTHKTGSTTMLNIFSRFSRNNNLTVALPKRENYLSTSQSLSSWQILPPPTNRSFDIIFHHCAFNPIIFKSLLPKDSFFIASVREPISRFISAFNYYRTAIKRKYLSKIPGEGSEAIHTYLQNPEFYDQQSASYTRNSMAYDFGYPSKFFKNESLFDKYLLKMDKYFDFVIVAEYFDESLVLLKRLLHWRLRDMLYLPLNKKPTKHDKVKLSTKEIEIYKNFSKYDFKLYDFFLVKFNKTVSEQSEDYLQEVTYFRSLLKEVTTYCKSNKITNLTVQSSKWSPEFGISKTDCKYMETEELDFTSILKKDRLRKISQYGTNMNSSLQNLFNLNWGPQSVIL